jgi:hypothetical protein
MLIELSDGRNERHVFPSVTRLREEYRDWALRRVLIVLSLSQWSAASITDTFG